MSETDDISDERGGPRIGTWLEQHPYLVGGGLVFVTLAIYAKVLGFGVLPFSDDLLYFVERETVTRWTEVSWVRRVTTPQLGYPVPIPTALYAGIRELQLPTGVAVVHGLNLAFHVATVLLVYALARHWVDMSGAAAGAALLWAVHPIHAESVCWMTSLKFVSFGAFFVGAVLVWSHHLDDPSPVKASGTVLLGLLALGCRPEAVMLSVLLAVLAWLGVRGFPSDRSLYIPPTVLALAAAVYVPVAVTGQHANIYTAFDQNPYTVWATLLRVGTTFKLQLTHLLWPFDLHPAYYYPSAAAQAFDAWIGLGLFAVMGGATAWAYRSNQRILQPLAFFWVTYLPISGLEYLPRGTADAYAYVPSFGLLVAGVSVCAERLVRTRRAIQMLAIGAFAVVALAFGLTAFVQADRWRNSLTLWEPLRKKAPYAAEPHRVVGEAYFNLGRYSKALEVFQGGYEAMRREERFSLAMLMTLERLGRPRRALELGLENLEYTRRFSEDYEGYLLTLMAEHELTWPTGEKKRAAIERVVQTVLEEDRLTQTELERVAEYLEQVPKPRLAEKFRAEAGRRSGSP